MGVPILYVPSQEPPMSSKYPPPSWSTTPDISYENINMKQEVCESMIFEFHSLDTYF